MWAKIVVLVVLAGVVCAKPGYLGDGYPAATSHVSRIDIHAKPLVDGYASPFYGGYRGLGYGLGYGHGYGHGYGRGYGFGHGYGRGYGFGHGYPVAQSYSNRIDIHDGAVSGYGQVGFGRLGYDQFGYGYDGWPYL